MTDTSSPTTNRTRRAFFGTVGALGAASLVGWRGRALAFEEASAPDAVDCSLDLLLADDFDPPLDSCVLIPQETAGPYPLSAILGNSSMIRRDITEGRAGVPMTLILQLVNLNDGCAPIADAAVYLWQCDKDGVYSGYSQPGANTVGQTFCRGIQSTDCRGKVGFTSIYPGWYSGRITHLHFQIFLNSNTGGVATATSQVAFPQDITRVVYASPLYAGRGQNTSVTSFAQDNVFSDGVEYQLATVAGDTTTGYVARLTVGVRA